MDNMNEKNIKNKDIRKKTDILRIVITSITLVFFFIVGCLMFLRPAVSESEKRNLTEFPEFTWEGFLSGEWTNQLSLWYSDTYPMREGMIKANNSISSLYGVVPDQYAQGNIESGDELNKGDKIDKGDLNGKIDLDMGEENDVNAGNNGNKISGLYVVDNSVYELYSFSKQQSLNYVKIINKASEKLKGKVNVYNIIVPLSYEYALGDNVVKSLGAADCSDAIDYMYSAYENSNVKAVNICPYLRRHKDEYLYFRTDHHWTALGAYYAYEAFCDAKGITPTPLSAYEELEFEGFLGTLHDDLLLKGNASLAAKIAKHPDTVHAYVPMGTNKVTVTEKNGNVVNYSVVNKATDTWYTAANSKYGCFIAGDNPISVIHNETKKDGSSIVLVKESFGNAFAPFLVDSYEYVYVIDYRYYDGNVCDFAIKNNVDDILFMNYVMATGTSLRLSDLLSVIE